MSAGNQELSIQQNATFQFSVILKDPAGAPVDLTGASVKMEIRNEPDGTLFETLSTVSGEITIPIPTNGQMNFELPPARTAALDFATGQYDVLVTFPTGTTPRILQGLCTLSRGVTEL